MTFDYKKPGLHPYRKKKKPYYQQGRFWCFIFLILFLSGLLSWRVYRDYNNKSFLVTPALKTPTEPEVDAHPPPQIEFYTTQTENNLLTTPTTLSTNTRQQCVTEAVTLQLEQELKQSNPN